MKNYDSLVANGILYAPIRDIIMSDGPMYGIGPYDTYKLNQNIPQVRQDSFIRTNKPKSSLLKWVIGIAGTIAAVIGLKKGVNFVRNSAKCQEFFTNNPKLKSVLSKIKSYIPFVKKW